MKLAGLVWAGLAAAGLAISMPAEAARKPKPVAAPAPVPPAPSVKVGVELWRSGDYAGAVAMWQPFANGGDADAMFNIGQAYKLGRALPKDAVTARDWYRRAALKGHLPAQANLGILLFQAGEKPEAIRWLKSAADKNEMRAQYVLGVANWNGDGTQRNLTLAYAYLARASAQGLPEATTALNNLSVAVSPLERANGWAVATSLAAGNGVPPELVGGAPPVAVASARDQMLKPAPRAAAEVATAPVPRPAIVQPAVTPSPAPAAPPVAVAQAPVAPRPSPPAVVAQPLPLRPVAPAALPSAAPAAVVRPPAPTVTAAISAPAPATPAPRPIERPAVPPVNTVAIPASGPASPPATPASVPEKPAPKPVQVAVAIPKPAAASKPAMPKPAGWRVQLGAFSKRTQAEAAWTEVKTKQKLLVAKASPIFSADGSVTKLQMGPYVNKAAARDACAKIAFSGRACFVTES